MANIKRQQSAASERWPALKDLDSSPKILFVGDPHGDFAPVLEAVERMRPEATFVELESLKTIRGPGSNASFAPVSRRNR